MRYRNMVAMIEYLMDEYGGEGQGHGARTTQEARPADRAAYMRAYRAKKAAERPPREITMRTRYLRAWEARRKERNEHR